MPKYRNTSLTLAETFDAWRIVPRLLVISYGILVFNLYQWYISLKTFVEIHCDAGILQTLLANHVPLEQAKNLACIAVGTAGGPTSAQTAFVTTIIGLSSAVFAAYTTTGRRWERWNPNNWDNGDNGDNGGNGGNPYNQNQYNPNPYIPAPYMGANPPSATPQPTQKS